VLSSANSFLESQWWADAGFAVVVADGRGTPGRDAAWERAVAGDLAGPVLADQIAALHAAAEQFSDLDTDRVAIRGWSFGGYLAALAVLRRPDVFHAAIAGAPVTDWALYDTHYTERYLGTPTDDPDNYARSSLCTDGVLSPAIRSARCCWCTAWPTTTSWPRTPCNCPRRCWPPAGRTRCCRCPASPT
jgi:dipeptidyl-peptidase-4